jgi:predicted membrane-bound spermidine synthase
MNRPFWHRLVVPAVFLVSAAGLVLEITLTRLFSLFFQYHFAFLAVSLAVLGLSLGAAWERIRKIRRELPEYTLANPLAALSLSLLLAALALSWLPAANSILLAVIIGVIPFVFVGRFMAALFACFAQASGRLYAADLIGGAAGVLGALALLSVWSPFSLLLLLGGGTGLLTAIFVYTSRDLRQDRRYAIGTLIVGVVGIAMLGLNVARGTFDFDPARLTDAPRDKTMLAILSDPAQKARIVETVWSPFARVDVVETADPRARYIFTDAGAGSYMLQFDGALDQVSYLKESIEYLPFTVGPTQRTLILGAGGGKDILMALQANAQAITAVEVNSAVIAAARAFADYNGRVLDLPQVTLIEGDARTFVERSTEQFDLIYLNLVYTQATDLKGQALLENYIFTREAFRTYLERLKPGGYLAIVSHNALEGSRAALTALQAMEDKGVPLSKALDHIMLWLYPSQDATLRTSVFLLGIDPFTKEAVQTVSVSAKQKGLAALFAPGDFETLFSPLRKGARLDTFVQADAEYDLSPTDDDKPYFFNLDHGLPPAIQLVLLIAALLAIGLFVLSLTAWRAKAIDKPRWIALTSYAALIGAGFMLIEIPLIQRLQLLLGHPILAIATVLGVLLFSSGVGSLISQRWAETRLTRRTILAVVWIAALAIVYRFAVPLLIDGLLGAPIEQRVLVAVGLTALLGVAMGVPFPTLLRLAGDRREPIAMLWALNGAFSVLGSTLAVVFSMTWGFSSALLAGAALYLLVAGAVWSYRHV